MSVQLRPLREDEFPAWAEDSRVWYEWDLVEHGGMRPDAAQPKAVADMAGAFTTGLA